MKRLVYQPKIEAWVNTDFGIVELEPVITAANVKRNLDAVSTAELTIRNPDKRWTDHRFTDTVTGESLLGPIFHPMDPITITLTRLQNKPVQVFTGFLDETPYVQMFPGTVTLKASCTLKKLLYTYFDPGLPFFQEFLSANGGWQVVEGIGIVNPKAEEEGTAREKGALTDTGFGQLLLAVLNVIGKFSKDSIYIEEIPPGLIELVSELFREQKKESKEANEEFIKLFHKIIGTAALGEGELSTGTGKPGESGGGTFPVEGTLVGAEPWTAFAEQMASETGLSLRVIGAWCIAEGGPVDNPLNMGPGDHFGTASNAAKEASANLRTPIYEEAAIPILSTVGKTDQEQIHAIAISPWCGEAGYEELIKGVYNTRVKVIPKK